MFLELNDKNLVVLTAATKFNENMIEVPDQDCPLGKIYDKESGKLHENYYIAQNKKIEELNYFYESSEFKTFFCSVSGHVFKVENISRTRDLLAEQIRRLNLKSEMTGEQELSWAYSENGIVVELSLTNLKKYWLLLAETVDVLYSKKEEILRQILLMKSILEIAEIDFVEQLNKTKDAIIKSNNGVFLRSI